MSREYSRISPYFWTGETGRGLVEDGPECVLVALYLITGPHANMFGLYYLPLAYICEDLGMSMEGAYKALERVCSRGLARYDEGSKTVFLPEMARWQIGERLKEKDNRIIAINKGIRNLPKSPFLIDFYSKYKDSYHLVDEPPYQAPSKPLRSQEQEQEQEQETHKHEIVSDIFFYWQTVMKHPRAKLDDKRKQLIRKGLKTGYSPDDLKKAIIGCSKSPHHMGKNDGKQIYDGIHNIFRDSDQIEKFMGLASKPDLKTTTYIPEDRCF